MATVEDKRALLAELLAELDAELERSTRQAKDAAEGATHEDNRAEGDKDMRSTEASYVARGQAARVADIEEARRKLAALDLEELGEAPTVRAAAIVTVEHAGRRATYFIVPAAGGRRLSGARVGAPEVTTLATTSPLGRALLGLGPGDEAEVATAQGVRAHAVVAVT